MKVEPRRPSIVILAACVLLACVSTSHSQPAEPAAERLSGTLAKVKATKTVSIGYRSAAAPFSYLNAAGSPIGYSIDLCGQIVAAIQTELGDGNIGVRYVAVDTRTRIPRLLDGTIDLECGTTTNNAERRTLVAFSPVIFVSGTKLAVRRASSFRDYRDLARRTVVVTPASTNEAAIAALNAAQNLGIALTTAPDNHQAFGLLASGAADAWAGDDAVLFAAIAQSDNPQRYTVLDPFLSYDPYGIMYRRDDPQLAAVVRDTFERLAQTRELARTYEQWFLRKLPSGPQLGIAMSPQLESIFESLGQPEQ